MKRIELKDNNPIKYSDLNDTENEYVIEITKSGLKANVEFFYLVDTTMKLEKKVSLVVKEGIVNAEVYLNMKAIILEDGIDVDFKPILEIESNEVTVDHSVSIGYLDKDLAWFLESRGIGKDSWKGLWGK
jgi:hypothetical protein